MRNILLTIAYDGTSFCGWQRQPGQRSIQGEIERVLSVLCKHSVQIHGTSRTDAGVHAWGQRAHFHTDAGIPAQRIPVAASNLLASNGNSLSTVGEINILMAEEMPMEFHARFDAKAKRYCYHLRSGGEPDLFRRNYCYQLRQPLDVASMRTAALFLTGTKDFRCFMASGGQEMHSTVRTIYEIKITEGLPENGDPESRNITLEITGNGFLYNMVRIITGTLVEVGLGKRQPEDLIAITESMDRSKAGHTAPPQGLYLAQVYFEAIQ